MVTKATSANKSANISTDGKDEDVRVRNARRAERASKIARMQASQHAFAGPALAMHRKVCEMEDALARERTMLMAILKQVQ